MAETTANEIQSDLTTTSTSTGVMARTGGAISELRRMASQPAVQRAMPAAAAILVAFIGLVAYLVLQQPSRTTLYASLPESEKSKIEHLNIEREEKVPFDQFVQKYLGG